jgi:hypothetical protein
METPVDNALPPPCPSCQPFDGSWISTPDGLRRCVCPRGEALKACDARRHEQTHSKAQREAEKDAESKRERREKWQQRNAIDRQMAARYEREEE